MIIASISTAVYVNKLTQVILVPGGKNTPRTGRSFSDRGLFPTVADDTSGFKRDLKYVVTF